MGRDARAGSTPAPSTQKPSIMNPIYIFLITDFEEIEAIATIDVLRRAELNARSVSLTGEKIVVGKHNVPVTADLLFEEVRFEEAEMLVLPGGTANYNSHEGLKRELKKFYDNGGKVAAICASPMVLGGLGILKGRYATCYPGFEQYLEGSTLQTDKAVVKDGNIITGKGPGLTTDFALTLVETIAGKEQRDEIAAQLLV